MKCFWDYICRKCNHAGIWTVNYRLASFQIGVTVSKKNVEEVLSDKLVYIDHDKIFVPSFVRFQYGNELKDENRVHRSVMNILEKNNLIDKNGTIKDLDSLINEPIKHHSNSVNGVQIDSVRKSKKFEKPTEKEAVEYFIEKGSDKEEGKSFWNFYESKGWVVGKSPMKNWHSAVSNWLRGKTKGSVQRVNERAYIEQGQKEKDHGW
jgi:hypothetical protein